MAEVELNTNEKSLNATKSSDNPATSENQQKLDSQQKSLHNAVFRSMKRTQDMFYHDYSNFPAPDKNA